MTEPIPFELKRRGFTINLTPELFGKLLGVHSLLDKGIFTEYKDHIVQVLSDVIKCEVGYNKP